MQQLYSSNFHANPPINPDPHDVDLLLLINLHMRADDYFEVVDNSIWQIFQETELAFNRQYEEKTNT